MDPATRSRARLVLPALPFAVIAAIAVSRMVIGPGWGLLPLLAVGPAVAAAVGGPLCTLAAGALASGVCVPFAAGMRPAATHRMAEVAFLAVAGVTAAGVPASRARRRRGRELAQARLVAEAAQKALLRPVPHQAGPVQLAARYLSACSGARVGGDLYEVVTTPDCVRLIVGDAEGKGLPAVQSAAAVLGAFREAAHEESTLEAIVSRIETSLARQLSGEQFVTAILAEVSADGTKIELLSCGHPAPLLLGSARPRFIGLDEGSLPLGLGELADVPRMPVTIAFEPGDALLFYTDGASEARNKAGAFFPLADCAAVRAPLDPATLPGRLGDEVIRHVGHAPDDDMALLVIYRDGAGHPGSALWAVREITHPERQALTVKPGSAKRRARHAAQHPRSLHEADGHNKVLTLTAGGSDHRPGPALVKPRSRVGQRLKRTFSANHWRAMTAQPFRLAGSGAIGTGLGWLAPVAEMAARASANWLLWLEPGPRAGMCCPKVASRMPGTDAGSVRAARDFTVATLQRWGATDRWEDIAIVTSELLTNALQHALPGPGAPRPRCPLRLGLLQPGPYVLCAVADPSQQPPVPKEPSYLDETGRGLHLISALADTWGYTTPSDTGKVVWAMFSAKPAPRVTRAVPRKIIGR